MLVRHVRVSEVRGEELLFKEMSLFFKRFLKMKSDISGLMALLFPPAGTRRYSVEITKMRGQLQITLKVSSSDFGLIGWPWVEPVQVDEHQCDMWPFRLIEEHTGCHTLNRL